MNNVHHKSIKRFHISGSIKDDSSFWRLKDQYIQLLISEMRFAGYVPRLDINPDFTVDYNKEKECYEFELSIYGVYLGKKQSQWIDGIDETQVTLTAKNKSKESSQVVD